MKSVFTNFKLTNTDVRCEGAKRSLSRRVAFGFALALLLMFSYISVLEVQLPEANAAIGFSDYFANLNNWTVIKGVWTTTGSTLQGVSSVGGEDLIWAGNTTWTDYELSANVKMLKASEDVSVVLRYIGPTNFYWLGLGCWGHKYSISKVVDGVYTELAYSGVASQVEVDRWYSVSAIAVGNNLQLFVDGVMVLEVQDSSHPTGAVGFRNWNGTMQAQLLVVQSESLNIKLQMSDGGYVLAGTSYDGRVELVKTDSNENRLWSRTYGETSTGQWTSYFVSVNSLLQTNDGGFLIWCTEGTIGSAHFTSLAIKTDAMGNQLWSKSYPVLAGPKSIIKTADNGFAFVCGPYDFLPYYLYKIDSNGNVLWNLGLGLYNINLRSMVETNDGGFALACSELTPLTPTTNFWLVKVDWSGNLVWNKTYGGTGDEIANSVIQTNDGGYALAGFTNSFGAGGKDFWLVKTDSVGNLLWSKTYGGPGDEIADSVIQTSDGGYVLEGSGITVNVPADAPPIAVQDYDGLWHTTGFTITLTATDDFTSVGNIYYRINDGPTRTVSINGQPVINIESASSKLEYWSVDSLGHEELPHKILTGIKLDETAPTGSIVINKGDAFTSSSSITLTLTANDLTSGVSQVRYSNDGVWDIENWETPSATKAWTLTSGVGTKTVYYQVKDNAELLSTTYSNTIILETPTPTPTPSPSPSPSPSPTPTISPSPSPTPIPTTSPTPYSTASPTPTSTPTPTPTNSPTTTPNPTSTQTSSTPTPNPTLTSNPTITATPTPTPNPNSATIQATTASGTTLELTISGNITSSQISDATILPNQAGDTTTLSFTITGQEGTIGFGNIIIPKSAIPYGTNPTIYIDAQQATGQGWSEDANNFHVWFITQISTHLVSIVFTTDSSLPSEFSLWIILPVVFVIACISLVFMLLLRRKNNIITF